MRNFQDMNWKVLPFSLNTLLTLAGTSLLLGCINSREVKETSAYVDRIFPKAPYLASTAITDIEFAPDSTVLRLAEGSDNWPLTWGAADRLYTTYGDGQGFEPKTEDKLGLGFAYIEGNPPNIKGVNIRSTGENTGSGRRGKKGSGILMLGDTIFVWLMHADERGGQAQLAWSTDQLKTLREANWKFSEFGLCSFINYGAQYQGAPDSYVYIISHDGARADTPADQFVLMRAPRKSLLDRQAYEFYAGTGKNNPPIWTDKLKNRVGVFRNRGACLRSSLSYNPGLKKYLWWQQLPNYDHPDQDFGDTRFQGGFGIYESSHPWGPWSTVFFTPKWHMGPGEIASFPVKWLRDDGKSGFMTFSGEDAFSVIGFELQVPDKEE